MASRASKAKIHKIEGNYIVSPSQHEEGRTELTEEQRDKVDQLSKLITGYYDNFFTLACSYNPKGYIDIFHSQFDLKLKDNMLEPHQQQEVLRILNELRLEFGVE